MELLQEKLNINQTKQDLRKFATEKRNLMSKMGLIEKISDKITKNILSSFEYKNSKHIAFYYPIKNEIDITGIFNKNKNFYLPKCVNNEMFFCKINSLDELKKGAFNIPEPQGERIDPDILDIIYIPALMANKKNYRLGYGKGFYDRFFKKNNIKAKKIIIICNAFLSDEFVEDEYDYTCDKIITEKD